MKNIGISYYPDFYDNATCKKMLDKSYELDYRVIFTSLILHDYGFVNTVEGISDETRYFLNYAHELGFEVHADITRKIFYSLGARVDDLSVIKELKIPVIRLDGGFNDEEIITLTHNEFGIKIEDNLSSYRILEPRLKSLSKHGNLENYLACHNFFPRNNTGISIDDAVDGGKMFKKYNIKTGIFIGSTASESDLNDTGQSVMTVENHRYIPSEIQLIELMCTEAFDYFIFGDSLPSFEELKAVSIAFKEYTENDKPLITIPCYFECLSTKNMDLLTSIKFEQRIDAPEYVIRGTKTRGKILLDKQLNIKRRAGSITIDNLDSNRYTGEMQICLSDLPAAMHVNVIGMVKPYAFHLLQYLNNDKILFKLKR